MLGVIFLSFFVMGSMAQIPGSSPCKQLKAMTNFNQTKFVGNWYEFGHSLLEPDTECRLSEVTENPDRSVRYVRRQLSNGQNQHNEGKTMLEGMNENGIITVTGPKDSPLYNLKCWILSTDYVSYAVKGTCENVGQSSGNYYWILTRSSHPSQEVLEKIQHVLNDEGIPERYLNEIMQNDCPGDF